MKLTQYILIATAVLVLAGAAQATHLTSLEGTADCDGWMADGAVYFGTVIPDVTVSYVVELTQDGVVVTSATGAFPVTTENQWRTVPFDASGMWGMDLCGAYVVEGVFTMSFDGYEESMTFTAEFVCDCPPETGCYRTPGYWKNHDWPVETLVVGGVESSRNDLLAILEAPVRGDATVILAHHLIAAKLNVISGADDGIQGTIDAADALLAMYPVFSKPRGDVRHEALMLKDELADYNEQGCPEDEYDDGDDSDKAGGTELRSWSDMKGLYR